MVAFFRKLSILFVAVVFTIMFLELVFGYINAAQSRLSTVDPKNEIAAFGQYDPYLGYRGIPNVTKKFMNNMVTLNAKGFRGTEYAYEKPANTKRVVILGDSQAWGYGLDDDETISAQLSRMLSASSSESFEVVNLAFGGYGVGQEFLSYLLDGVKFDPDYVVLVYFHLNDLEEAESDFTWGVPKARFVLDKGELCLTDFPVKRVAGWPNNKIIGDLDAVVSPQTSQILRFLATHEPPTFVYTLFPKKIPPQISNFIPCIVAQTETITDGEHIVARLFVRLQQIISEQKKKFLVVTVPTSLSYENGHGGQRYRDLLEILSAYQITTIDMLRVGVERGVSVDTLFRKEKKHFSAYGTMLMAEEVAQAIR